jgi:two-component sensor histidine kinase
MPEVGEALGRAVDEVETVIAAHHRLSALSPAPTHDPGPDLAALAERVRPAGEQVRITTELAPVAVAQRHLLTLLLLAHEAVANAAQHAFPGGRTGRIRLTLDRGAKGAPRLRVADDGIGLPAGLDFPAQGRCGALLLRGLTEQSGALLTVSSHHGTTVTVELPPAAGEERPPNLC